MKKDKDAFIKVLIVLVIASLSLLAIVYVMQSNRGDGGNFTNPFSKTEDKIEKFVITEYNDFNNEFVRKKCTTGPWHLEDEKSMDFEEAGIKFKYLNRPISNDYLLMDNFTELVLVPGGSQFTVPYYSDKSVSNINQICGKTSGSDPARLDLLIVSDAIGFEEFDSKGEINGVEYLETINDGSRYSDKIIKRIVLINNKGYIFSSAIIEESEVGGENGEMIHIDGFDGEAHLDYVFKSLEFLNDNEVEEGGEDMIGAGGPNPLGGNKEFLDIKNYYSMPDIQVGVAFCEESGFAKYVKETNEVGYGHILGLYEEEYRVLFKIMERGDWSIAEIEKEMKDNICGLGDEYFGTIGDSDEYLLFIRNCPAAGSPEDEGIAELCSLRKSEVKELMNWK